MAQRLTAKQKGDPILPGFRLDDSPFYVMNRTIGFYDREMTRLLKAVGVDIPRWRILMLAHERAPVSLSDIAEYGLMKQSTATRVVQRLRRDGLITVDVRPGDARVSEVALTEQGAAAVERIRTAASKVYARAFRDLDPTEVTALLALLRRVQAGLTDPQ